MIKLFLRLLVIVCFLIAGWTAYLLFTQQIDPVIGGLILVVDIGVLIWNLSVLRKYRVSFKSIIFTGIILALLVGTGTALAGIEPVASYKNKALSTFDTITSELDTASKDRNKSSGTFTAALVSFRPDPSSFEPVFFMKFSNGMELKLNTEKVSKYFVTGGGSKYKVEYKDGWVVRWRILN